MKLFDSCALDYLIVQ